MAGTPANKPGPAACTARQTRGLDVPRAVSSDVPDELYARASAHYDDKALWTFTLAIGQICFFIPVALIAKPILARNRITASNAR